MSSDIDLRDRDLIIELVVLTQELERLPTAVEINDCCQYSHQDYRAAFGSLTDAYVEAGLLSENALESDPGSGSAGKPATEKVETARKFSSANVSSSFEESKVETGKESKSFTANGKTIRENADLDLQEDTRPEEVSQRKLIEEILWFENFIREPPTEELVKSHGTYASIAFETTFDSWSHALQESGLDPSEIPDWSKRKYTNSEILYAISSLADELSHPPTTTEMNKHGDVSGGIGSLRFGSWANAIEAAGRHPGKRQSVLKDNTAVEADREHSDSGVRTKDDNKYSDGEILQAIQDVTEELGHPPSSTEMNELGAFSSTKAVFRFGSWDRAIRESQVSSENSSDQTSTQGSDVVDRESQTDTVVDQSGSNKESKKRQGVREVKETATKPGRFELIMELMTLDEEVERVLVVDDLSDSEYTPKNYTDEFGSWQAAIQAANIK
ncbi:homing endonuclease associated repeat-containing protein [Haloprofundus marisrubri]|uniref:homing endonuclease associated repeat-containing protein n=1 Tax=Haloprofundus marisrubri TaxID=1514971 RepID=UPI0012BAB475|nr:hypothetical protein [Haloprofundus marisrubri]